MGRRLKKEVSFPSDMTEARAYRDLLQCLTYSKTLWWEVLIRLDKSSTGVARYRTWAKAKAIITGSTATAVICFFASLVLPGCHPFSSSSLITLRIAVTTKKIPGRTLACEIRWLLCNGNLGRRPSKMARRNKDSMFRRDQIGPTVGVSICRTLSVLPIPGWKSRLESLQVFQ